MNMPRLLLHACCAPDTTVAAERLRENYDITAYFYNPCIAPKEEYDKREQDAEKVAKNFKVKYAKGEYDAEKFLAIVKGLENEPEKGERCRVCYEMRLERCAKYCKDNGYDFFTTTLTVSPHKDADVINNIGRKLAQEFGVGFLDINLKKQDGFKKSLELSKKLNLYRQNYCGCVFSKK